MRFKTKQDDKTYDEDKQKMVYRLFEFKNMQQLKLKHFMRFFKCLWRFINYDANLNNLVSYQEIRSGIETYEAPLALTLEEQSWE